MARSPCRDHTEGCPLVVEMPWDFLYCVPLDHDGANGWELALNRSKVPIEFSSKREGGELHEGHREVDIEQRLTYAVH